MLGFIPPTEERPVKCFCCQKPMYYIGDSRHEHEFEIIIKDHLKANPTKHLHFIHSDCWYLVENAIQHVHWIMNEKESS